jgi:transposase
LTGSGPVRRVWWDVPGQVRHKDHMPVSSPFVIVLTDPERRELSRRACSARTPHRDRIRARIVLSAADGASNAAIVRQVGVGVDTVRKWRRRFAADGLAGLRDSPRSGRPRRLPDAVRAQVIALTCELPATSGVPLSRWSGPELARELAARCPVRVSASTVRRWLAADALKPWQHRSWISIRDPDFPAKAARVLDLYARLWDGRPLGENDFVICADEKTSIQARCRCHPTRRPGGPTRCGSSTTTTAAGRWPTWPPGTRTAARSPALRGGDRHRALRPAGRAGHDRRAVRVGGPGVLDQRQRLLPPRSIDRMQDRWPNAHLVHTPIHASWLNQCEIYFSVVQRKVVAPNDFTDLDQIRNRLAEFETRYNAIARPFNWRFTSTDLNDLLDRLPAPADRNDHPLAA